MDKAQLKEQVASEEVKLHQLEDVIPAKEARLLRQEIIEEKTGITLNEVAKTNLNEQKLFKRNIENLIGSIEIPLGLAGPLKLAGDFANGEYYVPLATTEGALVASTNRGARVTSLSGGIRIVSDYVGVTRAPLFRSQGIKQNQEVITWVRANLDKLKGLVLEKESHLRLLKIDPYYLGTRLWLRMYFDSSEAMGMNMATKAADYISAYISSHHPGLSMTSVSGNLCMDKKANVLNSIMGRGRKVSAEALIPSELVTKYLKTTIAKIVDVHQGKVWQGSAMAGGISFNAHFANIIAATFAATGQDLAHVVDSSQGYSFFEAHGDDLYVSVTLPSLMLGHVGGGTGLAKQFEARELMLTEINSKQSPKTHISSTLAEIIAAAVLCGELSLHAALTGSDHVTAHESLGRTRK